MEVDGEIDPVRLAEGAGVPHGRELVRFVDAIVEGGDAAAAAREEVADVLGPDAMVDAAAVVANFFMMTRVSDATGTPLDPGSESMSADLRSGLGIEDYASKRLLA